MKKANLIKGTEYLGSNASTPYAIWDGMKFILPSKALMNYLDFAPIMSKEDADLIVQQTLAGKKYLHTSSVNKDEAIVKLVLKITLLEYELERSRTDRNSSSTPVSSTPDPV